MKKVKLGMNANYGYVVARVKAKRSKLLGSEVYAKLLKMEIPEISRFIGDLEYREQIDELASRYSGISLIENALTMNREQVFDEILTYSKGDLRTFVAMYLAKRRVRYLQYLVRGKIYGAPAEDLNQLAPFYEESKDARFLTSLMAMESLDEVIRALAGTEYFEPLWRVRDSQPDARVSQPYEDALERAYYAGILKAMPTRGKPNQIFRWFLGKEIDLRNITTLLKAKLWGYTGDIWSAIIDGGHRLDDGSLGLMIDAKDFDALVAVLKSNASEYYEPLKDAIGSAGETNSLNETVRELKKLLAAEAQKFSFIYPISILPIVNYVIRKNYEVNNLRIIARGKEYGLPESVIREELLLI